MPKLPAGKRVTCAGPDRPYVGCAGWTIPKESASRFPTEGTHLVRYSQVLPCAEINTTFYRSHRQTTYARWRDSVPDDFRFSVKLPKQITHDRRLVDVNDVLTQFLGEVSALESKLGCLLVQLPPSLKLAIPMADAFFSQLRQTTDIPVVCEPRHSSWFEESGDELLRRHQVARAAVDPAVVSSANSPGGWPGLSYYRWHGSPRMYYSAYDDAALRSLADCLRQDREAGRSVWCVFDNTGLGAAAENAVELWRALSSCQTQAREAR